MYRYVPPLHHTLFKKMLTTDEHHPHSATASGRPSRGSMAIRSTAATTSARKTLPTRSRPLGSRQGCLQSSLTRSLKATTPACPSRASRTSGKVSWDRTRRDSPFYGTFHITLYHFWPVCWFDCQASTSRLTSSVHLAVLLILTPSLIPARPKINGKQPNLGLVR